MASTWAQERLEPLAITQIQFNDFNICRLMAEKAMYDQDYKTLLERSAHGHGKPTELTEADVEIMASIAALRQNYENDVNEAWTKLRRRARAFRDRGYDMVAPCRATNMTGEGSITGFHETNVRDTEIAFRARVGAGFMIIVSGQTRWGLYLREAHVSTIRAPLHPMHAGLWHCWLQINVFRQTPTHSSS